MKKKTYDTKDSRVIPHLSTNFARRHLTSQFGMGCGARACSMAVCATDKCCCCNISKNTLLDNPKNRLYLPQISSQTKNNPQKLLPLALSNFQEHPTIDFAPFRIHFSNLILNFLCMISVSKLLNILPFKGSSNVEQLLLQLSELIFIISILYLKFQFPNYCSCCALKIYRRSKNSVSSFLNSPF